ncbi:hypothetical protein D3C75_1159980 [compost metagenome]
MVVSFNPVTPASSTTIRATFSTRNGSPNKTISAITVPAVPSPTNTAYTVPAGSLLLAEIST